MNSTGIRAIAKQKKKAAILQAAEVLFLKKGIDSTTMNDIANEAGIGIATLFRYYPKKEIIILTIASGKLNVILESFQEIEQQSFSYLEKVTAMLDFFIFQITTDNGVLPKLLDNFVNYTAVARDSIEDMSLYLQVREQLYSLFFQMIESGKTDGTVRQDIPTSHFISTIVNNFSIFTLKLSLKNSANLLEPKLSTEDQLHIMKTVFLDYLKA